MLFPRAALTIYFGLISVISAVMQNDIEEKIMEEKTWTIEEGFIESVKPCLSVAEGHGGEQILVPHEIVVIDVSYEERKKKTLGELRITPETKSIVMPVHADLMVGVAHAKVAEILYEKKKPFSLKDLFERKEIFCELSKVPFDNIKSNIVLLEEKYKRKTGIEPDFHGGNYMFNSSDGIGLAYKIKQRSE